MVGETQRVTAAPKRPAALAGALDLLRRHALLLIVLGGAVIRFATLGSEGFWFDEHLGLAVIAQHPSGMLQQIMNAETNPPLYFVVAKGWVTVFGSGEVGIRSLSALAGTATIPVVYAAGLALGSRRAGLFAAALTAASPFMIWYSQEGARPYALFAFFSALAFLFFVQTLQGRGSRWLWAWTIASILTFSTHYFGFLLIGIEAVWLLWRLRGSRVEVALSLAVLAAAAVPLGLLGLAQRHLANWIPLVDSGERLLQVPQHLVVGLDSPWAILPPIVVAFVAVVVIYAIARAGPDALHRVAIPGGVALAAIAITVIAMLAGSDYLDTRNLIGMWPPFAIALGVLLAVRALKWLGATAVAALCAMGIALAVWTAATPAAGRPDWGPLAAGLGTPTVPRVIEFRSFISPLVADLPNAYEASPGEQLTAQEVDVVELRPVPDYAIGPCWWAGFCGGENMIGGPGELPYAVPDGFKLVGKGQTSLFTYRRYRSRQPVELPPAPWGGVIVQAAS